MQFLTIIRKADFIDLFKYGHIYVRKATSFEGNIDDLAENVDKFKEVTSDMNIFEYFFEYLMLHFSSDLQITLNIEIEIQDVIGLYVFSDEAKKEMSISFDPRINIRVSNWAPLFSKRQEKFFLKQSMRGIDNLWQIFNLDIFDKQKCAEIITEPMISEAFRELFAYERPQGALSPWVYLLRYERHSLYPKSTSGFFCDFIHVYINWMQQKEQFGDVAEMTELYNNLIPKSKFKELLTIVESSPLSIKCGQDIPNCKFYIVAPLFLYLKSRFDDEFKLDKETKAIVDYSKSEFGFDFALATYLLGITMGYDRTYDCLYDSIGLKIFKTKSNPNDECEIKIHIHNGKRGKNKHDLWVNQSELESYLEKGWKIYKKQKKS